LIYFIDDAIYCCMIFPALNPHNKGCSRMKKIQFHKSVLAPAICLAIGSSAASAAEPVILVEDAELTNPSEVVWPPQEIQPGMSADGGELLRNIPGISGNRMGGHGIDPIIRGQSQNRLNIILDGAYMYGGCPNRMDPATSYAKTESYDQVTIIKGSQTVTNGPGGPGGTVLFERETERFLPDEKLRGSFSVGYQGNADTKEASLDVAAGNQTGFLRLLGSYADSGNYEDGDGYRVNTAFESKNAMAIFGLTPDDDTSIELSFEATRDEDVLYPGAKMDAPYSDNDTVRFKFKRDAEVGPFSAMRAELYSSSIDHLMDNYSLRAVGPMKMATETSSDTFGGTISADLVTDGGTEWTFGIDHQTNEREARRYFGPGAGGDPASLHAVMWPDVDTAISGIFAEFSRSLSDSNSIKAGLRYDHVSTTIRDADVVTNARGLSPNNLFTDYYGDTAENEDEHNIGGFFTFEHRLSHETALFGTLSRSVRTADATERYLAGDHPMAANRWVGNPNLDPEKHHQIEFGVNSNKSSWDLSASLFYNRVSDFILRDRARGQDGILQSDGATIYRNVDATLYGFEIDTGMRWNSNWSSRATMSYVHSENRTDDRPIAQTPPLEGTINLEYNQSNWYAGAKLIAQTKQTRVEDDTATDSGLDADKTPGWAIINLYGGYNITDNTTIKAGVDNLLDKTYAYHVNRADLNPFNPDAVQVNEPGRSAWIRLNMSF
jgi:iron complex outermembrane receptor protein